MGMKRKNVPAPQEENLFDDGMDAPAESLALVIEQPDYAEDPIPARVEEPLMYVCLNTLAVINHYSHLVPVCTVDDFAIACEAIWKAAQN